VVFDGKPVEIQLIVQQPASSLNPRFTAAEIVEEPLLIARHGTASERRERAALALETTGIARGAMGKQAHEFSGGERQRLAIARALVIEPKVLILDESFNGLDLAAQERVAALVKELQTRLGIACILISHDLGMVANLASEIGVLERGVLIELRPTRELIAEPLCKSTRELIDAARALHPGAFFA
jgi:ABC-type glutathione transport system ATPase component